MCCFPFLPSSREIDAQRIKGMSPADAHEYSQRYLHAAQAVRRKYGRRVAYRRQWLDGAWWFRNAQRRMQ